MNIKKMTAFASVAICAAVAFGDGIVSSNIAGVQNVTVASGYNIFTPTFKDLAAGTTFDLTDIEPLHQDGDEFGTSGSRRCNGVIEVNKINSLGNYTTAYAYFTLANKLGWYTNDGTKVNPGEVLLNNGEAILVNNQYKGQPVIFRVSGEVDFICINNIPSGYALYGNSTPVTINLSDIVMLHQDGEEFGTSGSRRCNGVIEINKISSVGNYTTAYAYFTLANKLGWYTNDGTKIEGDAVTFMPGEAFLINNQYKGQPVLIKLPTPIK